MTLPVSQVRFSDFGNIQAVKRSEFVATGAYLDIPALSIGCKLLAIEFNGPNEDALKVSYYIDRLKHLILNSRNQVFIGIKSENEEFLVSAYCREWSTDVRFFLVQHGYVKWDIQFPETLITEHEKCAFELVLKSTVPYEVAKFKSLVGKSISIEVQHKVSQQFLFARLNDARKGLLAFLETFRQKMEESRGLSTVRPNEDCNGRLVCVYDQRFEPYVWQRGQIVDLVNIDDAWRFSVYLLDHGRVINVPSGSSLHEVQDLEFFFSLAAQAVPMLMTIAGPEPWDEIQKGTLLPVSVKSVTDVVHIELKTD